MLIVILKAVWRTTDTTVTCSVIKNKKVATYATKNLTADMLCFRKGIGKEKGNASWQERPEELAELLS